jgi:ABC-type antimicrobial peptide transport system permease subunit
VAGRPPVVVINEAAATRFFPGASPIGRTFRVGSRDVEIVGVAWTTRYTSLRSAPSPTFYDSYLQRAGAFPGIEKMMGTATPSAMHVVLRSSIPPAALVQAIAPAIGEVEPQLAITDIKTQTEQIDASIASERLFTRLLVIFGVFAVLLACIGLHGVTSYSVAQRTGEIGIRVALGAQRSHVLWLILRQVLLVAGAGVAVGVPIAIAAAPLIATMLFGLAPRDVATIAVAALLMLVVAMGAGWLPARRAARMQVLAALRTE